MVSALFFREAYKKSLISRRTITIKKYKKTYIIGVDHDCGNIKTANCCFQTGVTVYDKEPIFKDNLLAWNNKYYLIGAEHKEFSADKMLDEDYYVLTLAAIARELNIAKIYSADVLIAAGLPLTWVKVARKKIMMTSSGQPVTYPVREKQVLSPPNCLCVIQMSVANTIWYLHIHFVWARLLDLFAIKHLSFLAIVTEQLYCNGKVFFCITI